jgi:phosphoglycolate phosphatase-like HAD superfamily hydrolase
VEQRTGDGDVDSMNARPVLCLDWNGTVVADDDRAHRVSLDVLAELELSGDQLATVADFRRQFTLPLATFFRSLGALEDVVDQAVRRWNELMLTAEPPRLTPGALPLLQWAMRHGVETHVISGADPRVPAADLQTLMPEVRVTSIIGSAHPKSAVLEQYAAGGPVVFVGDTTYDVREGVKAGVVTVGFASDPVKADRLAAAGADFVVTDLGGVQDLISTRYRDQETR